MIRIWYVFNPKVDIYIYIYLSSLVVGGTNNFEIFFLQLKKSNDWFSTVSTYLENESLMNEVWWMCVVVVNGIYIYWMIFNRMNRISYRTQLCLSIYICILYDWLLYLTLSTIHTINTKIFLWSRVHTTTTSRKKSNCHRTYDVCTCTVKQDDGQAT